MADLKALRSKLRQIDDQIMDGVVARFDIAREIGQNKIVSGAAIYDADQEESNRQHNMKRAKNRIPSELIIELTDLLAKWSRYVQEQQKQGAKMNSKSMGKIISGCVALALSGMAFGEDVPKKEKKPPNEPKGECHGINKCKGKGQCGGPGWECAGNNDCKGKGWLTTTAAVCKKNGGTFKPD